MKTFKQLREKLGRQLKDPKKEVMVVDKKGKTIVIDKSKEKEYLSKGWKLAEELSHIDENFRVLATKGMGAETKNSIKVGHEVDFYEPKVGNKRSGKITKMSGTGYEVRDEKDGKKYTFKFFDRASSKKLMGESIEEGVMKQDMMRGQDMAQLAKLYTKAMKMMPGSPAQKKLIAQIDQYRKELGIDESIDEAAGDNLKSSAYKLVHAASGKMIDAGSQKDMAKKMRELNKKNPKSHFVGLAPASKVGDTFGKRKFDEEVDLSEGKKRVTIGGTAKKGGMMFIGPTGIKKMIELSKKNPSIEYTVKSDNYGEFKPHWLKNGKFAKQTVANINFDFAKNAVRGEPKGKTVQDTIFSLMYQVDEKEAVTEAKAGLKKGKWKRSNMDYDQAVKMFGKKNVRKSAPARSGEPGIEIFDLDEGARADAMRAMKLGGTKGMATTKKDNDVEASDDDRKAASKNIIAQLRRAANLPNGGDIEFEEGGKTKKSRVSKVDTRTAKDALAKFDALRKPDEKQNFQKSIRSLSDLKKLVGR